MINQKYSGWRWVYQQLMVDLMCLVDMDVYDFMQCK